MLIDFHTHYYPEKIVDRAMASTAELFTPAIGGRRSDLEASMESANVDISVLLPMVNTPENCLGVNSWAQRESHGKIVALGSIHPADPKALEHLEMIKEMGFCGIKVHPEYQDFTFEQSEYFPVWEQCANLGLFVLTHAGFDIKFSPPFRSDPEMLLKFHRKFPNLQLVLAHFGSMNMWDRVERLLLGTEVYLDMAFITATEIPPNKMAEMIIRHGADKVLFGSDSPWRGQKESRDYLYALGLGASDLELVAAENAKRLLKL